MGDNVRGDVVPLTIIRTSDGSKSEIHVALTATLDFLKGEISNSELGPIDRNHQRLFHLGRELKSGRRSLLTLGLGKFDNFILHLHSTQPETLELSSDEEDSDDDVVVEEVVPSAFIPQPASFSAPPAPRSESKRNEAQVVDLADSDDEEVELVEPPPARRRRIA
eukprot:CAMPEP_0185729334 /NCGR_PEP_ID=MMETSP1171-20130828/5112_1 /TAXON_ID=374046 /ORGANISM="Helicotheca tamensis, Strain CCMP826" /LENGTH=164 /DNA_ID=CAMNT_0028398145 /DNA_START=146 /DNA_END=640 /DNA_ORIENTATION=-